MAQTVVTQNDALAIKLQSVMLFHQSLGESFWLSKFRSDFLKKDRPSKLIGTDPTYPIQIIRDLEQAAGDKVSYDLFKDIRGDGVYGDNVLEGKEKPLDWSTDELVINMVRNGTSAGGKMTRKRTKHDLRRIARLKLQRWFARYFDEVVTCYLAGRRGKGTAQWVLPVTFTGIPDTQPLEQSDPDHTFALDSGGAYTNNPANAGTFKLDWLRKLETYIAKMDVPPNPVKIGNEDYYIVVLSPDAVEQLKADTSSSGWLEIQKAAGVRGQENPIFKGALGMFGSFVLYEYSKIPIFDAGASEVSNNLVLGSQALVVAFGQGGGELPIEWKEKWFDYDNQLGVSAGVIMGLKKPRFDGKDFGVISMYSKNA